MDVLTVSFGGDFGHLMSKEKGAATCTWEKLAPKPKMIFMYLD
jgi:hypothetical protein